MSRVLRKNKVAPTSIPEYPWDRQPEEPDRSWVAFVRYRGMGPGSRALARVRKQIGQKDRALEVMSARWDWVARCSAYDIWVDKQAQQAEVAAVKDMRKRHIQMAMSLQGAAALALNKIITAERNGQDLVLRPNEVKELAELGLRIERLNRGEPESTSEVKISDGYAAAIASALRRAKPE